MKIKNCTLTYENGPITKSGGEKRNDGKIIDKQMR
jgi:hypothetical protein